MRGVTLPSCVEFLGHAVTAQEMREMFRCRRGQVDCRECDGCRLLRQFYRKQYVERFHFDRIADPPLQALMVDWAVTSSGVRPVKALQRALGFSPDASDGVFGPGTQQALARVGNARELYIKVLRTRSEFYIDCALNDPKVKAFMRANPDVQLHNLRGWNRERVLAFLA
jgi:lysozyme family protein